MKLNGQRSIPRSQQIVWDALNDPAILARAIPGCEKLERTGTDEFHMEMLAVVGPVRARFKATLAMSEVEPPRSYVLTFNGNGGVAGFGNGSARVELQEQGDGTLMQYEASAQVGGKIAQVGARLVQGVSEKLADQFFTQFVTEVEAMAPAAVAAGVAVEAPAEAAAPAAAPAPAIEAPAAAATAIAGPRAWYRRPALWVAVIVAIVVWWLLRG